MRQNIKCFINDGAGATSIEYSLFAALVGVVIITAVTTLGELLLRGSGGVGVVSAFRPSRRLGTAASRRVRRMSAFGFRSNGDKRPKADL